MLRGRTSGSQCIVQSQGSGEIASWVSGHSKYGGIWRPTVGDKAWAQSNVRDEREIPERCGEDCGSL
jgi:hypothetical protein